MNESVENKLYSKYVKSKAKKSPLFFNCLKAFFFGGLICTIGQGLYNLYIILGINEKGSGTLVSCTLIFLAALLTGLGIFDNIAKHAGAGTLVPITGFANAVVAPAIDNKAEGYVLGVGAKIFTIAGPVILFGTLASAVYGVICYIINIINFAH